MQERSAREGSGAERPDQAAPSDEQISSGLGHDLGSVDLEQAQEVGADPPGGLGIDLGGGTDGLGASTAEDEAHEQR